MLYILTSNNCAHYFFISDSTKIKTTITRNSSGNDLLFKPKIVCYYMYLNYRTTNKTTCPLIAGYTQHISRVTHTQEVFLLEGKLFQSFHHRACDVIIPTEQNKARGLWEGGNRSQWVNPIRQVFWGHKTKIMTFLWIFQKLNENLVRFSVQ